MPDKKLILASKSPRREHILKELGLKFHIVTGYARELHPESTGPVDIVIDNAISKALAVKDKCKNSFIIGADTIVYFKGDILIKPADYNQAYDYLKRLSGNTHTVYTGLAVLDSLCGRMETGYSQTEVKFRELDERYINQYIEKIHPYDKAGGYAIQGFGALIVERIDGCYFNVMGLPVVELDKVFMRFGFSLFDFQKKDNYV